MFYLPLLSQPLFHTMCLSQSQFWQTHKLTLAKMNKRVSLGSFFEKRERLNYAIAEYSKTANKKKATFTRKYQETYVIGSLQQVIYIL